MLSKKIHPSLFCKLGNRFFHHDHYVLFLYSYFRGYLVREDVIGLSEGKGTT